MIQFRITLLVDEVFKELVEVADEFVVVDEPVMVEVRDEDVTWVSSDVNHLRNDRVMSIIRNFSLCSPGKCFDLVLLQNIRGKETEGQMTLDQSSLAQGNVCSILKLKEMQIQSEKK